MNDWLSLFSIALIVSTSGLIAVRYVLSGIRLLAFQSLLLAAYSFLLGLKIGSRELLGAAVLTLIVKAILIPLILYRVQSKIDRTRQAEKIAQRTTLVLAVVGMWFVGYFVTPELGVSRIDHPGLSIAIGMLLAGVLVMITHKKAIMQGIGLIVIENSLFLAALSVTNGMPIFMEVGVFLDVLVIVVLMASLTMHIDELFASTNVEKLQRLKG